MKAGLDFSNGTFGKSKQDCSVRFRQATVLRKEDAIRQMCEGKSILDVGCAGQAFDISSPRFLHAKLSEYSAKVDGVDIATEGIIKLRNAGYNVWHESELDSLKTPYEVILMADVLEHVGDPQSFLIRYARHMSTDGLTVVTTPNANAARNFVGILLRNQYSVHEQHALAFTPITLLELAGRCGLRLAHFCWLKEHSEFTEVSSMKSRFMHMLHRSLAYLRTNFSANFLMAFSK